MEALKQWLIPYIISNIVFGLTIVGAYKKPMWARIFLAGFFLPATVLMAIAFYILMRKYTHDLIWRWKQYEPQMKSFVKKKPVPS